MSTRFAYLNWFPVHLFYGSHGAANDLSGIYSTIGGLSVVADTHTAVPGGGTFASFGQLPTISRGEVAFRGAPAGIGDNWGIYKAGSGIEPVARRGDPAPGAGGSFYTLYNSNPAISEGNIAFRAFSTAAGEGIYADRGHGLEVVADRTTPLPGQLGQYPRLSLNEPFISGSDVVFTNGNLPSGVYLHDDELRLIAETLMPGAP